MPAVSSLRTVAAREEWPYMQCHFPGWRVGNSEMPKGIARRKLEPKRHKHAHSHYWQFIRTNVHNQIDSNMNIQL